VTIALRIRATVPMMYSTPIQTAAFRSALMPGFPVVAAIVRFVFTLFSYSGRGDRMTTAVSRERRAAKASRSLS
jgi:hypothetical protein